LSILLGFKLAPLCLSLFVLGSAEAAEFGGNNYENSTNQLKQLLLWYVEEYDYTGGNNEQQTLASKG
jgi:hypothetical protein